VLSTIERASISLANLHISLISLTIIVGLAGVSKKMTFVFFLKFFFTVSISDISIKLTSMPNLVRIEENNPYVPP